MATKRADEFTAAAFSELELFIGQKDTDNSAGQRQLVKVDRTTYLAGMKAAIVTPALSPTDGTFRIKDGTHLQIWNPDSLKWHTVFVTGTAGLERLAFGPGET